MNAPAHTFFSWSARRVLLGTGLQATATQRPDGHLAIGVVLDERVHLTGRSARLIAYQDCEETNYVAVVIGDVTGAEDVPLHLVDTEQILIRGHHSRLPAEILVGVGTAAGLGSPTAADVRRQLCLGGPVHQMLALSGARSVVADWYARRYQAA
ncbi:MULTISPECIES: hypothetical protein [Rhodococcus]|uniref:hypothetical protein n=1 Tax=Rhodococcus TaxID=1827 RepID=UPI000C9BA653|nr:MULTISPECIES: hypothetical protein [Rhodococcus]PND51828.1 hypothetical protein CQZ88_11700 [Rhodococcus sp. ENV425]WKX00285.1 hypothetical protein Q3O43_08315 [Rhodococcus aetherivorans]